MKKTPNTSARSSEADRSRGIDATTLAAAFIATAEDFADQPALAIVGSEHAMTWVEYGLKVRTVAAGLAGLGLGRGDALAMLLSTRLEFHWFDSAAMCMGALPFSIYPTSAPEQVAYQLADAGARVLVTEQALLPVARAAARDTAVQRLVVVDGPAEGALTIEDVEHAGDPGFDLEAAAKNVRPEDVLTLIYTSGTTGPPKGVELTHANFAYTLRETCSIVGFRPGGQVLSWLPMAHAAERIASHYLPMMLGWSATGLPDYRQLPLALPQVRPTWFFAVPRIWEKLKSATEARVAAELDTAKRAASQQAIDEGLRRVRALQAGGRRPSALPAEHDAILSELRASLGFDRLLAANVGSAPAPIEVLEFWHAVGVPLSEVWGMSELAGAATINPPQRIRIGTVGHAVPGTDVRLDDDGEVLVRGPGMMKGYRNLPYKTAQAIGSDGWLRTGDVGEFDVDGYLRIVDRKKELIINAAGKNMSPANIEAHLTAAHPLVGPAIAIGDRRPYNVALITLDPEIAPTWARSEDIEDTSLPALAANAHVRGVLQEAVDAANARLARVEQIKRFTVLPVAWLPGGEELTPTMKLKRKTIAEKYAREIEALYAN
jgi:long-subunit acyl-CoA synthetase (AMP-forming)